MERADTLREEGRSENEAKYTEFRLGCDGGNAAACNSLGEWFALMRQDFATAVGYYRSACFERRYPQACLNYGLVVANGRGGVPISIPAAVDAFRLACDGGVADACGEGGRLLLRHYAHTMGIGGGGGRARGEAAAPPPTPTPAPVPAAGAAEDYSEVARSVAASGLTPVMALAPADELREVHRLYRVGCDADAGSASAKVCGQLAALALSESFALPGDDPAAAVALLRRACDGEHVASCFTLAKLLRAGWRRGGVAPDPAAAAAAEEKGFAWSGMAASQVSRLQARRAPAAGMK